MFFGLYSKTCIVKQACCQCPCSLRLCISRPYCTSKVTFPHIFFQILGFRTSQKVYKHPHVKGFLSKYIMKILKKKISNFFLGFSLIRQEHLDMSVFVDLIGSPDCEDLKKYMWEGYFRGTWNWGFGGRRWPLKMLKWQKPLRIG